MFAKKTEKKHLKIFLLVFFTILFFIQGIYADEGLVGGRENVCGNRYCESGENPANCPQDCTHYRVFLSAEGYNGYLGGVQGADLICQGLADSRSLGGYWKAYLGNATVSAGDRLFHSQQGYRRLDGVIIANSFGDLTDGSILNPISIDEYGHETEGVFVWTGSKNWIVNGIYDTCWDWFINANMIQNTVFRGVVGSTSNLSANPVGQQEEGRWEGYYYSSCNVLNRLYCIEQPNTTQVFESYCSISQVQCDESGDNIDHQPNCCLGNEECLYFNYPNGRLFNKCVKSCTSLEHRCYGQGTFEETGICCDKDAACEYDSLNRAQCGEVRTAEVFYSPPDSKDTFQVSKCSDYNQVGGDKEYSCNLDLQNVNVSEYATFLGNHPNVKIKEPHCAWDNVNEKCDFVFTLDKSEGNMISIANCRLVYQETTSCGLNNAFQEVSYHFEDYSGEQTTCQEVNCPTGECTQQVPCPRLVTLSFFDKKEFLASILLIFLGYFLYYLYNKMNIKKREIKRKSGKHEKVSKRK